MRLWILPIGIGEDMQSLTLCADAGELGATADTVMALSPVWKLEPLETPLTLAPLVWTLISVIGYEGISRS